MNQIQEKINLAFEEFKAKVNEICGKELSINANIHRAPVVVFTENAKSVISSTDGESKTINKYLIEHLGANSSLSMFSENVEVKYQEVQ